MIKKNLSNSCPDEVINTDNILIVASVIKYLGLLFVMVCHDFYVN